MTILTNIYQMAWIHLLRFMLKNSPFCSELNATIRHLYLFSFLFSLGILTLTRPTSTKHSTHLLGEPADIRPWDLGSAPGTGAPGGCESQGSSHATGRWHVPAKQCTLFNMGLPRFSINIRKNIFKDTVKLKLCC